MIAKVQFYEYPHAVDSSLQPIYPEYKQGEHAGKSRIQGKLLTLSHPFAFYSCIPNSSQAPDSTNSSTIFTDLELLIEQQIM